MTVTIQRMEIAVTKDSPTDAPESNSNTAVKIQ